MARANTLKPTVPSSQSKATKFIRSSFVVGSGAVTAYGVRFVRNIVLARMLSQADFGVCVAMTTLYSTALLLTNFGFEKLLIQEREISDEQFQPVLASLVASRMVLAAVLLFILAAPMARMFGVPEAAKSFAILSLSLIPLGFIHLDTTRVQKFHRFGPDAAVQMTFPIAELVIALVFVYFIRTYEVVPYSFIAGTASAALVSIALSERRYLFAWDKVLVMRALRFGLPLVGGGFVMLAASQADRIVVGSFLGVKELAIYGAVVAMISAPATLVSRVGSSLFLPGLAEAKSEPGQFRNRYTQVGIVTAFVTAGVLLPLMIFGPDLVSLLYGARYLPSANLVWTIALGQAAFLMRFWPNLGALAQGDTKNLLLSNVMRASGFVLAIVAARFHQDVATIAGAFACGEILGLTGALWLLQRRMPELRQSLLVVLLPATVAFGAGAAATSFLDGLAAKLVVTVFLVGGVGCLTMAMSKVARHLAARLCRDTIVAWRTK